MTRGLNEREGETGILTLVWLLIVSGLCLGGFLGIREEFREVHAKIDALRTEQVEKP